MGFSDGKVLRVTLRATKNQLTQVNVLHYDLQDPITPGDANDPQSLADTFRDDVIPSYRSLFGPSWQIQPVEIVQERDPQDVNAARSSWTSGTAAAGTKSIGSDAMTPGSCVVASLRTAHIGRRFRGRMFVGGEPTEGDANEGVWSSLWLSQVQGFVDAIPREPDIAPALSLATAKWSVFSRTQRAQDDDPYLNAVTSVILRSQVHFLRRRALYS